MSHVIAVMAPTLHAGAKPEAWSIPHAKLGLFKKACLALGLEERAKKNLRWYGTWRNDYQGEDAAYRHGIDPTNYDRADLVFGVKGNDNSYELGLRDMGTGHYEVFFDNYAGGHGLCVVVGTNGERLYQTWSDLEVLRSTFGLLVPEGASAESIRGLAGMAGMIHEQGLIAADLQLDEHGNLLLTTEPCESLLVQAGY